MVGPSPSQLIGARDSFVVVLKQLTGAEDVIVKEVSRQKKLEGLKLRRLDQQTADVITVSIDDLSAVRKVGENLSWCREHDVSSGLINDEQDSRVIKLETGTTFSLNFKFVSTVAPQRKTGANIINVRLNDWALVDHPVHNISTHPAINGVASLADPHGNRKKNVLAMFHTAQVVKPARKAVPVFQICNDNVVNPRLYVKLKPCFESIFYQAVCKQIYVLTRIGEKIRRIAKLKLSALKSWAIGGRDLCHAGAF